MSFITPIREKPFTSYWNRRFRQDLQSVLDDRQVHCCRDPETTIQPRRISRDNPVVRRMATVRRENFALALYLLLRMDHFVAAYKPNRYDDFAREFRAPAFIGDCPGGCCLDMEPVSVLFCLGRGRVHWQARVPVIPDPKLEPEVREIVRELVTRLLPNQDVDRFVLEFMRGWQPPIALSAMVNEQAMQGGT